MTDKVYVVSSCDEWDSWDIGYFKTKKAAFKYVLQLRYEQWELHRYIHFSTYGVYDYHINEYPLGD